MFFCLLFGEINLFKRDPIKKERQTHSIINKYNMNEYTLFSGFTSDPCEEVLTWKHPFTCIVGGPSGSGNTSFVFRLIKHAYVMFTEIPQLISGTMANFSSGC